MQTATHTDPAFAPSLKIVAAPRSPGLDAALLQRHVPVLRRRIAAGQSVFRPGQPFKGLLFVQAGAFKNVVASDDGRERVTGLRLRGELLATESIGCSTHAGEAVALDDGEVWELPAAAFEAALATVPELACAFHAALAQELRQDREWMLVCGTLNAEQRVAALLLEHGARYARLGFSATRFLLSMTRADMGSLLGLQLETVTRTLTSLDARGLIEICRRDVRIVDPQQLRDLIAGGRNPGASLPVRLMAAPRRSALQAGHQPAASSCG